MTNYLVIQPYGGAIIDNDSGSVEFLNEVATIITKAIIEDKKLSEISNEISKEFEVTFDEAIKDIENFISNSKIKKFLSPNINKEIYGNTDFTSVIQADIELTLTCDFNCRYCFANAGKENINEIQTSEWFNICEWLIKQGLRQATITGGDPLISESFWPLAEYLSDKGVMLQVFTSGSRINEQNAKKLSSLNINFVQLTLDSLKKDKNDRFRGKGSYLIALNAIKKLNRYGVPTVIASNIFPDTINEIKNMAIFAENNNCKLRCGSIDAHGRASNMKQSMTKNVILDKKIKNEINKVSSSHPNVFFDKDIENLKKNSEFKCKFYHGMPAIGSDGTLRPCLESKDFFKLVAPWALDERKAYKLENIEDHKGFYIIKTVDSSFLPTKTKCGSCARYRICKGCLLAGYSCMNNAR